MRGVNGRRARENPWLEQQVQFARGHWRREEQAGAVRSAGWWESVTVTLSPAAAAARPPSLLRRAAAVAADAIVPSLAELAAAGAQHLLDRWRVTRALRQPARRQLPAAVRALPRPGKAR